MVSFFSYLFTVCTTVNAAFTWGQYGEELHLFFSKAKSFLKSFQQLFQGWKNNFVCLKRNYSLLFLKHVTVLENEKPNYLVVLKI